MINEEFPMGSGQTLLVVEDEVLLRMLLAEVLESLDYKVIAAQSATEALAIMEDGAHFDVLLTDIVLPGAICGFELAKIVSLRRPSVAVIYSSGYTGYSPEEMGEVIGPLLNKPTAPSELARVVYATIDAQRYEAA